MSMNWERVKGVLESSDKVKEASKVWEEYAHDDYMFVSETKMAVGEEMVDLIQEEAEKNNYMLEDYKLLYEDKYVILWKELGYFKDGKKFIKTVCMFLKDGKIWRESDNRVFVKEDETIDG